MQNASELRVSAPLGPPEGCFCSAESESNAARAAPRRSAGLPGGGQQRLLTDGGAESVIRLADEELHPIETLENPKASAWIWSQVGPDRDSIRKGPLDSTPAERRRLECVGSTQGYASGTAASGSHPVRMALGAGHMSGTSAGRHHRAWQRLGALFTGFLEEGLGSIPALQLG
jgi:hypothetical protein